MTREYYREGKYSLASCNARSTSMWILSSAKNAGATVTSVTRVNFPPCAVFAERGPMQTQRAMPLVILV